MSTPAPSPPAGAPPEPPPPPPEPGLFYCYECGATVFLHGPLPVPPPSPLHVCPTCQRGFLEERSRSSSSPPPPPPPPHLAGFDPGSGSSSSSELSDDSDDDDIELASENYAATREYFRSVVDHSHYDGSHLGDAAAAAAMSALRQRSLAIVRRRTRLQPVLAAVRGGEPPAPAASIAALPTVEVAEPAAACAICKDDLPLASQARKLPCAHLYHSPCIVTWLEMHNSCPVCRFRIPSAAGPEAEGAAPSEEGSSPTQITIRFTTTARRRRHVLGDTAVAGPVSVSATQLAQAFTEDGAGGPANSGETVSSEWPPHPESDAVMSEAREGDGFFD